MARLELDKGGLNTFVEDAAPWDHCTYYISRSLIAEADAKEDNNGIARGLRNAAWQLYEQGLVLLFQKRLSSGDKSQFAYRAVRTPRPLDMAKTVNAEKLSRGRL